MRDLKLTAIDTCSTCLQSYPWHFLKVCKPENNVKMSQWLNLPLWNQLTDYFPIRFFLIILSSNLKNYWVNKTPQNGIYHGVSHSSHTFINHFLYSTDIIVLGNQDDINLKISHVKFKWIIMSRVIFTFDLPCQGNRQN